MDWNKEVDKLGKYLISTFGEEDMVDGESSIDMAIRLLDRLTAFDADKWATDQLKKISGE